MSAQQDSRKILEDLNFKKQQLQKGLTTITTTPTTAPSQQYEPPVSSLARATLSQAQSSSFGFFIGQDSHFGNTILPTLPRFE